MRLKIKIQKDGIEYLLLIILSCLRIVAFGGRIQRSQVPDPQGVQKKEEKGVWLVERIRRTFLSFSNSIFPIYKT